MEKQSRSATVVVAGAVLDILTNQPIANAHVVQGDRGTTTDRDGVFVFDAVPGDLVRITHISYTGLTFTPEPNESDAPQMFYLEPAAYEIPEIEIVGEKPVRSSWGLLGLLAAAVYVATRKPESGGR
jgi:hypothetical protein